MRRPYFLSLLLVIGLLLGGCKKDSDVAMPNDLFGKDWYNTGQQDLSGTYIYKPEGTFAPSGGWGIDGFRFETDGTFVLHTQGPADGPLDISGTWRVEDDQTYRIQLDDEQYAAFSMFIYLVEANSLKARRTP